MADERGQAGREGRQKGGRGKGLGRSGKLEGGRTAEVDNEEGKGLESGERKWVKGRERWKWKNGEGRG